MTRLFECEIRFKVEDIGGFEKRLRQLSASVVLRFEFTDHYYSPVTDQWDPVEKSLRIRRWSKPKKPTTIYFSKTEIVNVSGFRFKRALYPEGKIALFCGHIEICRSLLHDLGFQPWFVVRKERARVWELPKYGFRTTLEYIQELGWIGELECRETGTQAARSQLKAALAVLGIPRHLVSHKPMAALFAEATTAQRG